ncbi:MAG TPA: hypothetical protein VMR43_10665, partial [Variovorax sp.]|nr:hypothetical protein [Variovorax sp.]
MNFTPTQIRFLQDLHTLRPQWRSASATADFFHHHYALGVCVGRSIKYQGGDCDKALQLLQNNALPLKSGNVGSRADACAFDMSEKTFSEAPHADSIAIKTMGGCTYQRHVLWTPPEAHLVMRLEAAKAIECDRLLAVENFETFRNLEHYRWIEVPGRVLVVYRGDSVLSTVAAGRLLNERVEPVWAFYDFDPAGLAMAAALPRMDRILMPPETWLREHGQTTRGLHLYESQLRQHARTLDLSTHETVKKAWRVM